MNILWQKESNSEGANFVDLLKGYPKIFIASKKHDFHGKKVEPIKNNQISQMFFKMGREICRKQPKNEENFQQAVEFYNQSLRFAEPNSDNMSLAYASRSACFFNLKKYEKCLVDIELAKKTNYNGTNNLDERKNRCLKMKREEPEFEPKLSFPSNKDRPSLANTLKIKIDKKYGRTIVTDNAIQIGQTVLMEESFSTVGTNSDRSFCDTCLKFGQSFIPCHKCTDVMFCDQRCYEKNNIHKMACGSIYQRLENSEIILLIKTILCAMDAFPVAENLMEQNIDLEQGTSSQLRYKTFLKLLALPGKADIKLNEQYQYAMDIPAINNYFDTEQKRRFLMHMTLQHMRILRTNAFVHPIEHLSVEFSSIFNTVSMFNHSCTPNLCLTPFRNLQIGVTIRPVKKDEQLFITYRPLLEIYSKTTEERQESLKKNMGFECECSKCVPRYQQNDQWMMQMDSNYQFIYKFFIENTSAISIEQCLLLKAECFEFLRKFGHLPWSEEIEIAMMCYVHCIDQEYQERWAGKINN